MCIRDSLNLHHVRPAGHALDSERDPDAVLWYDALQGVVMSGSRRGYRPPFIEAERGDMFRHPLSRSRATQSTWPINSPNMT